MNDLHDPNDTMIRYTVLSLTVGMLILLAMMLSIIL